VININTKTGNVAMMSEEDYMGLMETLYLESVPGLKEELLAAAKAPNSEFLSEDEIQW
jgi:hypothetical protein